MEGRVACRGFAIGAIGGAWTDDDVEIPKLLSNAHATTITRLFFIVHARGIALNFALIFRVLRLLRSLIPFFV